MYLHLGNETVIKNNEIVGIFDLETSSTGPITREFLSKAEKEMIVTDVSNEIPKSFILCQGKVGPRVYISQIAPKTLKGRTAFIDKIESLQE